MGELDSLRHLQGYLYLIKWKGGYMFPTRQELKNPPEDGIYKTCVSDEELMQGFNFLMKTVLHRFDKLNVHFLRHSGYLFGFFKLFSLDPSAASNMLARDAGHSTEGGYMTIHNYSHDAVSLIQQLISSGTYEEERLGPWMSCYSEGGQTAQRVAAKKCQYRDGKTFVDIIKGFIEKRVGISPNHPQACNPVYVMEQVVAWRLPSSEPARALEVRTSGICIYIAYACFSF